MVRDCLVEDKADGGRFVNINRPRLGAKYPEEFTKTFGHLGTGENPHLGTYSDTAIGAYDYYLARAKRVLNKYEFPPLRIYDSGTFKEVQVLATDRGFNPEYRLRPPLPLVVDSKLLKEVAILASQQELPNHVTTLHTLHSNLVKEAQALASERGRADQVITLETLHSYHAFKGVDEQSRETPSDRGR